MRGIKRGKDNEKHSSKIMPKWNLIKLSISISRSFYPAVGIIAQPSF